MKNRTTTLIRYAFAAVGLFAVAALSAHDEKDHGKKKQKSDEWLATARAEYPLTICVVSDEALEEGDTMDHVHKQEGKPDRLVRFCCPPCLDDFNAEPAKFLKMIDEAAAKQAERDKT
jgi:hypothetical protein